MTEAHADIRRDLTGVRAGLLHTVPALAGAFQTMIAEAAEGIDLVHICDPFLLDTAVRSGVTNEVTQRVAEHIGYLRQSGARGILVTCSSIGEAVEVAAEGTDVPVIRVDAPMAAEAARIAAESGAAHGRAGNIRVLATLSATLGPTGRLIERAVGDSGTGVTAEVVDGAIEARNSGDQAGHDRLIREAVSDAGGTDVVVLAQASMAQALQGVDVAVPVLTSPSGGVADLLARLRTA